MKSDDDFFQELLATYRVEAEEHVQAMSSGLLDLEKGVGDADSLLETVLREAHSLKGASRAVNHMDIEAVCQSLEGILTSWKRGEWKPSVRKLDAMHRSLDVVSKLLAQTGGTAGVRGEKVPVASILRELSEATSNTDEMPPAAIPRPVISPLFVEPVEKEPQEPGIAESRAEAQAVSPARETAPSVPEKQTLAETVRIATSKLDALLLKAEETLAMKLTAGQRATELRDLESLVDVWNKQWGRFQQDVRVLRQSIERGERVSSSRELAASSSRVAEYCDWSYAHMKALESKISTLARAVESDRRSLGSMVDNLLDDTKKLLMMPFGVLLAIFPKLVRDLARDQGKEVDLIIRGKDVEIDKRILEEIKDPLIHLLRNCMDHGIEKPEERVRRGKHAQATLRVEVTQISGSEVEIVIADDGSGIDLRSVKSHAVKQGLITSEEAAKMDDLDALSLIFQSGVSTSPMLTEISGRGLGLAIVHEKVDKLNGHIFVDTHLNRGTTFRILLPLTLATFKGVLVEASGQSFVLPTANIERVVRVKAQDVQSVENRETIPLNGRAVSLVWLADVLELPRPPISPGAKDTFGALVLSAGEKRIAFRVDAIHNEQEVLVKPLGRPLVRVRNIAGATVLGSGKPAPILNVVDLIKSAMKGAGAVAARALTAAAGEARKTKSVLLADDSITARMLLKNILESAGYRVKTAVDGLDAWTTLKTEIFDAVVTDVDMPRMNGFELTTQIRGQERLVATPVILVTGRETREDRERGIDAGANAYIIKSSFDQSNLLEVLERLV